MFTKPIGEITFADVDSFCQEWPEGVRVEYKLDIKHIPKIVSSFANTSGGLFLIGVETDKKNNRVTDIPGISPRNGIEEQIVQSALMGIYPEVIPEVKILDVPHSNTVVVVVRVDESVQAPHAIQNSTRIYIRTGSVTQPDELADIECIAYMLKRREDSQAFAQQILNRIEERISNANLFTKRVGHAGYSSGIFPDFTVIARPVFPYRPLISASKIYESHRGPLSPPRRVTGGHFCYDEREYWELNEYGIVYNRVVLFIPRDQGIEYRVFLYHINELIQHANKLYEDCKYQGNVEVTAHLQNILRRELTNTEITQNIRAEPMSFDSEVRASKQCLARDLTDEKEQKDLVEELTCQLLWAFNIPVDNPNIREKIRNRLADGY